MAGSPIDREFTGEGEYTLLGTVSVCCGERMWGKVREHDHGVRCGGCGDFADAKCVTCGGIVEGMDHACDPFTVAVRRWMADKVNVELAWRSVSRSLGDCPSRERWDVPMATADEMDGAFLLDPPSNWRDGYDVPMGSDDA